MAFVKEHWILIAVCIGIYWIFFMQSGQNALGTLNSAVNNTSPGLSL